LERGFRGGRRVPFHTYRYKHHTITRITPFVRPFPRHATSLINMHKAGSLNRYRRV